MRAEFIDLLSGFPHRFCRRGLGFGDGSTPPGAQVPFGFARVSPDTCESFDFVIPFQHFGGYFFDDRVMRAVTHAHMQGSGAVDLGVVGVMPFTGSMDIASIDPQNEGFRQSMDKSTEEATPVRFAFSFLFLLCLRSRLCLCLCLLLCLCYAC